jgi:hypothetical protein
MLSHEVGHRVVGDPGQINGVPRRREELNRRRRQRQHLLVAGEPVHHAKTDVEVVQHRHAAAALADVLQRAGEAFDALRVAGRGNVGKDVDLAHGPRRRA